MAIMEIDGSRGEGGGQILRTSLSLSILTETPFRIYNIRKNRSNPGLRRQHLMALRGAGQISGAEITGDEIGSREVTFRPGPVKGGDYEFRLSTAGSTTLILQTLIYPLLHASNPSTVTLEGGTHNLWAPPFEFLCNSFLPLVRSTGPQVQLELIRPGFYPKGGGEIRAHIQPVHTFEALHLRERGRILKKSGKAAVSNLPLSIAHREIAVLRKRLGWEKENFEALKLEGARGPGNVALVEIDFEKVTYVATGFGRKGVPAEKVARKLAGEVEKYLATDAPVGEHLADQLLLLLAVVGEGSFRTIEPSGHTKTQMEMISKFLPLEISCEKEEKDTWLIEVGS